MSLNRLLLASLAVALVAAAPGRPDRRFDAESVEFFEKKVRPLLVNNCYNCHSANTNSKGGLRVDDRNGLLKGGNRGPAVVPGEPEKSLLIQAVRQTDEELKMPPKKHLSAEEIADLTKWIKDGAAWPEVDAAAVRSQAQPEIRQAPQGALGLAAVAAKPRPPACTMPPGRGPTSTGSSWRSWRRRG